MRTWPDAVAFCLSAAVSALTGKRFLNCLWELTYRCNARCGMCSYWKNPSRSEDELSLAQISEGLARIHAFGCRLVNFTGGEPTLREDLEDIVAAASNMGMWTSVVTNGSLLTRGRIRALKLAGLDNLLVSLDSDSSQVHDAQRGTPGSHMQVLRCLSWIRDEFLQGRRTGGVMCVISRANSSRLDEIVRLAGRLGVYVLFQPYHVNKTGDENRTALMGPEDIEHLLELKVHSRQILNSRSYFNGLARFLAGNRPPRCHAGLKYFSIDPYGGLHPCVDQPAAGHLLKDEIGTVRLEASRRSVESCRGCWYCFRGEADTSLSLSGCLEKILLGCSVMRHNAGRLPGTLKEPRAWVLPGEHGVR